MNNKKDEIKVPWYYSDNNPTYFYLELLNSILADILDKRHDEKYGFNCAFIIYSAFMSRLNELITFHPGEDSMINVIEIHTTMDYIASLYERETKEGIDSFTKVPPSWMLTHINYDSTAKKWSVRITRVNGVGKAPIEYGCREDELLTAIGKAVDFANQTKESK